MTRSETAGAHPDAELVLPRGADRPAWLAARREGLGGSDASTIAGVNEFSTLYELWLEKTGRAVEKPLTAPMRFGSLIEPVARNVFTEDAGIDVEVCGTLRSVREPLALYNPDGLTADGGVWECKSVGPWQAHHWVEGQVSDHAETQVQWGMLVTGRRHAWVTAVIEREFVHRRVDYDPELVEVLLRMGRDFWDGHVVTDVEPGMVPADLDVAKRQHPTVETDLTEADPDKLTALLAAYGDAKDALKAAKDDKDRLEAHLLALIGDAEAVTATTNGETRIYATRKTYTQDQISAAKVRERHPDVWDQYGTTITYRRLNVPNKPKRITWDET